MKKIIILFIFLVNISFSTSFKKIGEDYWIPIDRLQYNLDKLEEGDIVLFKPLKNFSSSFGHIAIIGEDKKMVDFPNPKIGFREMPFSIMALVEQREVIILRYKYIDKEFKDKLISNIYNKINGVYNLFIPRSNNYNNKYTYCSLFIYDVYENANNKSKSLFPIQSEFIWPEQFLDAGENFYIVEID